MGVHEKAREQLAIAREEKCNPVYRLYLLLYHPDRELRRPDLALDFALELSAGKYDSFIGAIHLQQGELDQAKLHFERAIQRGDSAADHFLLAMVLHRLGNAEQAQESFDTGCEVIQTQSVGLLLASQLREEAADELGEEQR